MNPFNVTKVDPQGYCGGVLKAISLAKQTRIEYPNQTITILGNLVHNEYVKEALQHLGIDTIDDPKKSRLELLDSIDEGIVIFTAHGVSDDVRKKAIDKHLHVIDASCPFVLQTQRIVQDKIAEGFTIFYIGKYKHPEAEAIYSNNESVYLIEKKEDIPHIPSNKIFVTNQTTMSILDIESIFSKIKDLYPNAVIHDEICNATRVRQQAILDLKNKNIDTLIVVGSSTSNNTRKLASIAENCGIPHILPLLDINELDEEDLKESKNIAVTSGASTPTYLTDQIIRYLSNYPSPKEKIRIEEIL